MSFERNQSFVEDEFIKAPDFEDEFDNIADYFNALFQSGRLQASAKPTIGVGLTDIAGTSKTITVARPSILKVWATFDVSVAAGSFFTGVLTIGGVAKASEATCSPSAAWRGTVGQDYEVSLGVGSHDLKLQCKRNGVDVEIFDIENTGFSYMVIPEP